MRIGNHKFPKPGSRQRKRLSKKSGEKGRKKNDTGQAVANSKKKKYGKM